MTTLVFLLVVVSFHRYEVSRLTPLTLYPVVMINLAGIPWNLVARMLVVASPFAVMVGIFNPLMDSMPLIRLGEVSISGGWVSCASILLRFVLTVSVAIALAGTTGYRELCSAMEKLGCPRPLVTQCLMMYRYLFLLGEEASRMARAYVLRAPDTPVMSWKVWASLMGRLLLRTCDRAQRIHLAMLCRGFAGNMPSSRLGRLRPMDGVFVVGWGTYFLIVRFGDWMNPHHLVWLGGG